MCSCTCHLYLQLQCVLPGSHVQTPNSSAKKTKGNCFSSHSIIHSTLHNHSHSLQQALSAASVPSNASRSWCFGRSSWSLSHPGRGNKGLSANALPDGFTPGGGGSDSTGNTNSGTSGNSYITRRDMLLEYVKSVQPEFMDRFAKRAPEQVVEAMRQTVTNMLGTLPPQFFEVTVTTVGENLAQLMYSVMMTGYMFRNAQYRLELQQSLSPGHSLPDPDKQRLTDMRYERGVQKSRVAGEVLRWNKEEGPEAMDAVEYIELLEAEVQELSQQLEHSRHEAAGNNRLLEYLKSLQPQNLQELTASAGEDALEAMNTFIQRLLGVSDPTELKTAVSETTTAELAKLLHWLMVVGYSIRAIEVRYDMDRVLGMPVSPARLAELPPGEL